MSFFRLTGSRLPCALPSPQRPPPESISDSSAGAARTPNMIPLPAHKIRGELPTWIVRRPNLVPASAASFSKFRELIRTCAGGATRAARLNLPRRPRQRFSERLARESKFKNNSTGHHIRCYFLIEGSDVGREFSRHSLKWTRKFLWRKGISAALPQKSILPPEQCGPRRAGPKPFPRPRADDLRPTVRPPYKR